MVKELLKRERRKERKIKAGFKLRPKGRPRKRAEPVDVVAEQAYEIKRLKMEDEKKRVAAELQLHSDQGFRYTSQGYLNLTQEYGITPSMSRRGNCYDNAMAENFFSILKTECIYR